jgi:thiamine-monophosphate kinase
MFRREDEFVRWLRGRLGPSGSGVTLGIGDDAALMRPAPGRELILTSDWTIQDVHFRLKLHPPESVGHRALARAISDVAAMGGRPRWALVSLAISKRVDTAWVKRFYSGMARLARRLGVTIVGGDTSVVAGAITIDVSLVGDVVTGSGIRRQGALIGDHIFVSGTLGLSALGLELLEARSTANYRKVPRALRTHLYPEPQCALGEMLSRRKLATAMMDISDGLSLDLARLCRASGVGARIRETAIPVPAVAATSSPPLALALHGGEDYQLLFTVPTKIAKKVPAQFHDVALHHIGEIEKGRAVRIVRATGRAELLIPSGFDHFRKKRM